MVLVILVKWSISKGAERYHLVSFQVIFGRFYTASGVLGSFGILAVAAVHGLKERPKWPFSGVSSAFCRKKGELFSFLFFDFFENLGAFRLGFWPFSGTKSIAVA